MSVFQGKPKRSLISEPINVVTGSLGSGKTLWAIQQADLLRRSGDAKVVYQLGINEPDLRKLPELPFPIHEWHIHADQGKLDGAVIIIDEFHKWMPQRGQSQRPPAFVEEMAEARKRGVRFILLTQSGEFDHFLKGTRLNRHFYLSRKAGLARSSIYEWQNRFVSNPEENKDARAAAIMHPGWKHPVKEYGDWYVSAKSHHFRRRIPLRLWLVPVFVLAVGYFAVQAFSNVGALMSPTAVDEKLAQAGGGTFQPNSMDDLDGRVKPTGKADEYVRQFVPLVPEMPWSAPVYQGQSVASRPELYCMSVGHDGEEGCSCYTEQATPAVIEQESCKRLARFGVYNPFRAPPGAMGTAAAGEGDGKGLQGPRPPTAANSSIGGVGGVPPTGTAAQSGLGSVIAAPQISAYGAMGPRDITSAPADASVSMR